MGSCGDAIVRKVRIEEKQMNKNQKKDLIKIVLAAAFYVAAELMEHFTQAGEYIIIGLFLVSYVIVGYGPVSKAVRNIMNGQIFDENFLMTVATVGALALRQWDEAVAVMLFYSVGELFEEIAVDRSRKSISDLMDISPDYANKITESGEEKVDPYDIEPGDMILVKPGEKVPLDGVVVEGSSTVDTSALTGESLPRNIDEGMDITSGFVNLSGLLKIRVTSRFEESTVAKILDLVENAGSKKADVEKFITKFARYYTPAVVFAALALALLPPLLFSQPWSEWIYRALLFLVISCPCALVISVPLAFFGGIGAASKNGMLVKGSNYLEAVSNVKTVVFDKTGTLTTGSFEVSRICPADNRKVEELLEIAAYAENYSSHPISLSIKEAWKKTGNKIDETRIGDVKEHAGRGVTAVIDGIEYSAGNRRLMDDLGLADALPEGEDAAGEAETIIYIASTGPAFLGYIALSDVIKTDSAEALRGLGELGVHDTVMLTGDLEAIAGRVAGDLGISKHYSELLPQDKVRIFEEIISTSNGNVVFVGDGLNDAPTLARADVGIAMGGAGSQAAIEAADIVIMDDAPSKIPAIMRIARKTQHIAKQNVVFALAVKGVVLLLGAIGIANMWMAVFADVGVAVLCILNSMRMISMRGQK